MGKPPKPPKPPETIGIEVEQSGAMALRLPSWMSAKARVAVLLLFGAGTGGAWLTFDKAGTINTRFAAWAERQKEVADAKATVDKAASDAILDRLDRLEAAALARMDRIEGEHVLLARDVAVLTERVREARRGERRGR